MQYGIANCTPCCTEDSRTVHPAERKPHTRWTATHCHPVPGPWGLRSTLCFCECDPQGASCKWNSAGFALLWWPISPGIVSPGSSKVFCIAGFPSFLRLSYVPLYVYTPRLYPSIHPSVDTWVVCTSWLLWIMLPWTWGCSSSSGCWPQFSWIHYTGMDSVS